MELVDIVNEEGNLTGKKASRKEAHRDGLLHSTIHVLVYNSKKQILLQKRALTKDFDAGKWDFVLGGHISFGETKEQTVLKELEEEYGIKSRLENLEFIKQKRFQLNIPEQNWHDNEFNYLYFLRYNFDFNKLKLQKEEISEIKLITFSDLRKDILNPIKRLEYCAHKDYSYYFELIDILEKRFR